MSAYVILGNPENRRVSLFQAALQRAGFPPAVVVPWLDWLTGRVHLQQVIKRDCIVRIESPGENFEVEKQLLLLGAQIVEAEPNVSARMEAGATISSAQVPRLLFDRGRILPMRQWFLGFVRALRRVDQELAQCPLHRIMLQRRSIETMFSKGLCHLVLQSHALPVAPRLGAMPSFERLMEVMRSTGRLRVFLKPQYGSSASGVVALALSAKEIVAYTTVEVVAAAGQRHLYNSLRVRRCTDPNEIACIIDRLCMEDVHVEQWLPKATMDGHFVDLRVLVIGGRARHVVPRMSQYPMTNLHLGNRRGDVMRIQERMGEAAWWAALRSCERAVAIFRGAHYAGVDLLVRRDFQRHAVLELNAFGDLLPGVLCEGRDSYLDEILSFEEAPETAEAVTPTLDLVT